MTVVAERAQRLVETKVIRHVRTEAGVRRYKQPIGSIIIHDTLLFGLTEIGTSKNGRITKLKGHNGKEYTITRIKHGGQGRMHYSVSEVGTGRSIYEGNDETEAYARTAALVQEEIGGNIPGKKPGFGQASTGGWSKNKLDAISTEIAQWGNTATDTGNDDLANALWDIAGDVDGGHQDPRVARYQLEKLKQREDLDLDLHANNDPNDVTFRGIINSAIVDMRNEAKLPKSFDEEKEREYAESVMQAADANKADRAITPRPISTSELQRGQWVRTVDPKTGEKSRWMKVNNVAAQTSRSYLVRTAWKESADGDVKTRTYTRMTNRDKWETVDDVKGWQEARKAAKAVEAQNTASNARADKPADTPTPAVVSTWKPAESEYDGYLKAELANGQAVYMAPSEDATNVDIYDANDNLLATVTSDFPTITATLNDLGSKPAADDSFKPISGQLLNLRKAESEYDGYDKVEGRNGTPFYLAKERGQTVAYDQNDKVVARGTNLYVLSQLDKLGSGGSSEQADSTVPAAMRSRLAPFKNLKAVDSEYDGYDKVVGANGRQFYIPTHGNVSVAYDENDNEVAAGPYHEALFGKLNELGSATPSAKTAPKLTRLKSKFDGWKRFRMPDGKVIDVGQATDDDNRYYATGKDGWEDIVADGDTEEEVMRKLHTMIGIEQPTSFTPSNTDVSPKQTATVDTHTASPIAGMTQEEYDRGLRAGQRSGAARVIGGDLRPKQSGRGGLTRDDFAGSGPDRVAPKAADVQAREDEEERRFNEARLAEDRREPGPIKGNMPEDMAANFVATMADDYEGLPQSNGMMIARALRNGDINTEQAARVLRARAKEMRGDGMIQNREFAADNFDEVADKITNHDLRTPDQMRRDANIKRERARAEILTPTPPPRTAPTSAPLQALDNDFNKVFRNGKPLTRKDRDTLNVFGVANGHPMNRLKAPSTINMHNRMMRLAQDDHDAYVALQDRATTNYLNGATPAASWKEAIEAAERMPVATHVTRHEATRDGAGQYVVVRTNPDGTREEIASFRPRTDDRTGFKAESAAKGRMNQENRNARNAATRTLPVVDGPSAPAAPENAPAASTAGVRRRDDPAYKKDYERGWTASRTNNGSNGLERADDRNESTAWYHGWEDHVNGDPKWTSADQEDDRAAGRPVKLTASQASPQTNSTRAQTSVRQAVADLQGKPGDYVDIADVRDRLNAQGFSRAEQDAAFVDLLNDESVRIDPQVLGHRTTIGAEAQRAQQASVRIGGEDRHKIAIFPPREARPIPGSPAAMHNSTGYVEKPHADQAVRNAIQELQYEPGAYVSMRRLRQRMNEMGYSREDQDNALRALTRSGEGVLSPESNQMALTDADRAAAVQFGGNDNHLVMLEPRRAEDQIRDAVTRIAQANGGSSSDWVNIAQLRAELPNINREEFDAAVRALGREKGVNVDPDPDRRNITPAQRAAAVTIAGEPHHLIAIQPSSGNATGVVAAGNADVAEQARTITEDAARGLARVDPGRFLRVVATRYFRPDGTFKNLNEREAYDELMEHADRLDRAMQMSKPQLDNAVRGVITSLRIGHAGMMGTSRTMITIRKVLNEEYGK